MPDAYAEINGSSQRIIGGSYSVGWGTPPGTCGLAVGYSFAAPGRVVTLEIKFRGMVIKLRDALVIDPRASGSVTQSPVVNFSVLDRRWRWITAGRIYGNYNEETPQGTLLREQSPQQLATLLYQALGEQPATFDVSDLPNEPRPRIAWDAADPRDELERLCADFGCVPLWDPIADRNYIARIGFGDNPPDGSAPKVISINQSIVTPAQPSGFRGVSSPALFQTALALGEPVGMEVDGSLKPIDQLSYRPAAGWQSIDPWDFKSLNSEYTDLATNETLYHRDLAIGSVWRMYRISGQAAGGFSPVALQGSPYAPTSIKDLGPFTGELLSRDLATGARLAAYARGIYADERLGYDNTKPNSRFPASISIDNEKRVVSFDRPLFLYGAGGKPFPAEVVLIAAYQCSKDGVPVRYEFAAPNTAPGLKAGEAIDVRDDITLEVIEQRASANGQASDNRLDVERKLTYYLTALAAKYRDAKAANVTFGGLQDFRLDGQLRSITWAFSANETPTTQCSWNAERSKAVIPWDKRNLARAERSVQYWQRQFEAQKRIAASRESAKKTT